MLGGFAEFSLRRERQLERIAKAKAAGVDALRSRVLRGVCAPESRERFGNF
jgi:hypothetical protein